MEAPTAAAPPSSDPGTSTLRLVCLSGCELRFVGRVSPASDQPQVQRASLVSARSSLLRHPDPGPGRRHLGDEELALSLADSLSAAMSGADTLTVGFAVPPLAEWTRHGGPVKLCLMDRKGYG